jgi:hypothetical protein
MTSRFETKLTLLSGITLEQARDGRARAWGFVFECYEENKAAGGHAAGRTSGQEDARPNREPRTTKEVKPGTS